MRKRNSILGILFIAGTFFIQNTNAENIFYQNENGVVLTESEYKFYSELYWEGYQQYITQEDYVDKKRLEIFDKKIEKKAITNFYPKTRGSSVTSNFRTTTIAKVCSTNCTVSLVTEWNGNPFIKSYDVTGVRVSNAHITSIKNAFVSGNNYGKTYSNPQSFAEGFGYSILYPNTSEIRVTLTLTTTKGGTIYGTYQHAMSNTNEYVSKQYSIGMGGYGNVFKFIGSARAIYDNAPGVVIELS